MTKLRAPLSFEQALARIAGQLDGGFDAMGALTARSASTVRAWGDPDRREHIPLDCAVVLDLAYVEAGGEGAPLHEAYTHQLEQAALLQWAAGRELARHAALVIKECGEAGSALVLAVQPGACPNTREQAAREVAEALDVLKRMLPLLRPDDGTGDNPAQPP